MKLLDTWAWIEYFKGTQKGKEVKQIIEQEDVCTSMISLAEIAKWVTQNSLDLAQAVQQVKQNTVLLELDESLLIESGKFYNILRAKRSKIGMIDVIIYITAIRYALSLITGDKDLIGLPNVEVL